MYSLHNNVLPWSIHLIKNNVNTVYLTQVTECIHIERNNNESVDSLDTAARPIPKYKTREASKQECHQKQQQHSSSMQQQHRAANLQKESWQGQCGEKEENGMKLLEVFCKKKVLSI
jgi:hypothetical protein